MLSDLLLLSLSVLLPPPLAGAEPGAGKRIAAAGSKKGRAAADQWWHQIDTGPFLAETILEEPNGSVAALKGLAVKVGPKAEASLVFDTELLAWRAGFEGSLVLDGTPWSGTHGGNSHYPPGGTGLFFRHASGLGFAVDGAWRDPREQGKIGRAHV